MDSKKKPKSRLKPQRDLLCERCGEKVPHSLVNSENLLYKCLICGTLKSLKK